MREPSGVSSHAKKSAIAFRTSSQAIFTQAPAEHRSFAGLALIPRLTCRRAKQKLAQICVFAVQAALCMEAPTFQWLTPAPGSVPSYENGDRTPGAEGHNALPKADLVHIRVVEQNQALRWPAC